PEHEVVDEQLRASPEKVRQRGATLVGLEAVVLVDPNPRQLLPPPRQLVAAPRELLLGTEQLQPRLQPFLSFPGLALGLHFSFLSAGVPCSPVIVFSLRLGPAGVTGESGL